MSTEKAIQKALKAIQSRFDKGLRVSTSFGLPQVMRAIEGTRILELVAEPPNKPALLQWLDGYGAGRAAAAGESWDLADLAGPAHLFAGGADDHDDHDDGEDDLEDVPAEEAAPEAEQDEDNPFAEQMAEPAPVAGRRRQAPRSMPETFGQF